jgi:hypothetical protein
MELKELRKLPMPKLRDLAKQETELTGVIGMAKEDLIRAIAAAKGIVYDETTKDANAIHAVKQDIRALKKQKAEILASADHKKLKKIQRKVKLLKRLTRHLAHEAKRAAVAAAPTPARPAAPTAETPPSAGS